MPERLAPAIELDRRDARFPGMARLSRADFEMRCLAKDAGLGGRALATALGGIGPLQVLSALGSARGCCCCWVGYCVVRWRIIHSGPAAMVSMSPVATAARSNKPRPAGAGRPA
jgi:hypothetical protein